MVATYDKALVSIPQLGSKATALTSVLDETSREFLDRFEEEMLLDDESGGLRSRAAGMWSPSWTRS